MGTAMLDHMETMCRKLRRSNEAWGGLHIVAMGDIDQLPPVLDTCPWYPMKRTKDDHGRLLGLGSRVFHDLLEDVFFLKDQRRQRVGAGADDGDVRFVRALRNVAAGECTKEDCVALGRRTRAAAPSAFDAVADDLSCIHLFSENKAVDAHNANMCGRVGGDDFTNNPVLLARAANTHGAEKLDTQTAGGVPDTYVYRRGTRVMLRRNVCVEAGLFNGTMGIQIDVGWIGESGVGNETRMPDVVLVAFPTTVCMLPSFDGMAFSDGTDTTYTVIPIVQTSANNFQARLVNVPSFASRTGMPLSLAYALTMHKCQGLTLERVAAHLPPKANMGAEYVAWSRVKNKESLVIVEDQCPLDFPRLLRIGHKLARDKHGRERPPQKKKLHKLKAAMSLLLKKRAAATLDKHSLAPDAVVFV